ncbi:hypothetical protein GIB67_032258, partial [Kingdonia uniflora]
VETLNRIKTTPDKHDEYIITLGLQEVPEITQTSPLPLQIIPAGYPRKKTQKTSPELNPRFFSFLSLTLSYSTEAFNIHYLFIGFPLGHLRSTYHEIIHRFGLN